METMVFINEIKNMKSDIFIKTYLDATTTNIYFSDFTKYNDFHFYRIFNAMNSCEKMDVNIDLKELSNSLNLMCKDSIVECCKKQFIQFISEINRLYDMVILKDTNDIDKNLCSFVIQQVYNANLECDYDVFEILYCSKKEFNQYFENNKCKIYRHCDKLKMKNKDANILISYYA